MPAHDPIGVARPVNADVTNANDDPCATTAGNVVSVPATHPSTHERYKLGAEIARGGMGVVYQARDTVLDREVAIKVLKEKYGTVSIVCRRFADEARIAAQLQHPAIPPVHDLGILPDGRPFLAMKLIKGNTLDELLDDRENPTTDRGRFFAIFEQICQALAYAHSHNVIHRDLKPANVMVGKFGEVQVMDWGLAKVLGTAAGGTTDAEETTAQTLINNQRDTDDTATQAGSVLGTPAFMPPEQAIGAIGKIDFRSDVFGLGGILAVILTGKPPFSASSAETTRLYAAQGQLDDCFARLDACGADPEHIALCKQCLAPKKENRPTDASEVAKAVAALRSAADERARQAELNRAKAEAESREQRKRRKVQLQLAGAIGLLLLVAGASAWWVQKQETERKQKELDNRQAAESALDFAEAALKKDDPSYGEIDAALDQASRRLASGGTTELHERLEAVLAARKLLERLDKTADQRWTMAQGSTLNLAAARSSYQAALRDYGLDFDTESPEVLAGKIERSLISARIKEALDAWLESYFYDPRIKAKVDPKLPALLAITDPDPARTAIRKAIVEKDENTLKTRVGSLDFRKLPPSFAMLVGMNKKLPTEMRQHLLRESQLSHPNHFGLAMVAGLAQSSKTAEDRAAYFRVAVALRPKSSTAHNNLGWGLQEKGDMAGALAEYHESLRLEPNYAKTHNNLGWAYMQMEKFDPALVEFRKCIQLDPEYALVHSNVGALYANRGDVYDAIAEHKEALRLDPGLVIAQSNLSFNLQSIGKLDEAIVAGKKATEIDPTYSEAWYSLALALKRKDDLKGAIEVAREGVRRNPKGSRFHYNLAWMLRVNEDHDEAISEFRESLQLSPNNIGTRLELGWTLMYKGDLDGAIAEYKECVRLNPKHEVAKYILQRTIRMKELLPQLPDIIAGKAEPKNAADSCVLALCCAMPFQNRYALSVRLYEKAFQADPKLVDDPLAEHRWYAACYAARAARGDGIDAPKDPAGKAKLRDQCYAWMMADFAHYKKLIATAKEEDVFLATGKFVEWLGELEISEVRVPSLVNKLPADEAKKWTVFWEEVKAAREAGYRTMEKLAEKW